MMNPGPTLHGSTIQEIAEERDALREKLKEEEDSHRESLEMFRRVRADRAAVQEQLNAANLAILQLLDIADEAWGAVPKLFRNIHRDLLVKLEEIRKTYVGCTRIYPDE